MIELLRSPKTWARAGGVASLLLSGWFIWAIAAEALWRRRTPGMEWIPVDPWPLVNAIIFAAVGMASLRVRDRARPWLLGGGLVTVLHSVVASRVNSWGWAAVALGVVLAACAVAWERTKTLRA